MGSVYRQPVGPVGVNRFGESGAIRDVYRSFGPLADQIVNVESVSVSRPFWCCPADISLPSSAILQQSDDSTSGVADVTMWSTGQPLGVPECTSVSTMSALSLRTSRWRRRGTRTTSDGSCATRSTSPTPAPPQRDVQLVCPWSPTSSGLEEIVGARPDEIEVARHRPAQSAVATGWCRPAAGCIRSGRRQGRSSLHPRRSQGCGRSRLSRGAFR